MSAHRIERIVADAWLSDAREELERAAEWVSAGDVDWQAWIDDWHRGLAVVLTLRVSVVATLGDGDQATFECVNHSIWIEKHVDPPRIQEQVRTIASKDFDALSEQLQAAELAVRPCDLEDMYVEVRLDPALEEQLREPPSRGRGTSPRRGLPPDV